MLLYLEILLIKLKAFNWSMHFLAWFMANKVYYYSFGMCFYNIMSSSYGFYFDF
jgi:hypothetical protein